MSLLINVEVFCLPLKFTSAWVTCFNFPHVLCLPQAWRGLRTSATPATWTLPSRPCLTGEPPLFTCLLLICPRSPLTDPCPLATHILSMLLCEPFPVLSTACSLLVDGEEQPRLRSFGRVTAEWKLLQCTIWDCRNGLLWFPVGSSITKELPPYLPCPFFSPVCFPFSLSFQLHCLSRSLMPFLNCVVDLPILLITLWILCVNALIRTLPQSFRLCWCFLIYSFSAQVLVNF